jgi:hypothetical protein
MKLEIENVDVTSIMYDRDPTLSYKKLVKSEDTSGLFDLKDIKGVRFTMNLEDPTPGFFFSMADVMDEKEGVFVLVYNGSKVGGYIRK